MSNPPDQRNTVGGHSLTKLINRPVLLSLRRLIAYSVVSALHYLHTRLRVIHRDVKPSNILISRSGKVKMCDFGISGYLVDSVAKVCTLRSILQKCPLECILIGGNFYFLEEGLKVGACVTDKGI